MQRINVFWRLRKNLELPRKAMDRLRNDLLQRQIKAAYQQVPFYRRLFDEAQVSPSEIKTIADLHRLPIISKKDIRQNQQWILNRKYKKTRCYRSHTSGSTGEPTWTYFDRYCLVPEKIFLKNTGTHGLRDEMGGEGRHLGVGSDPRTADKKQKIVQARFAVSCNLLIHFRSTQVVSCNRLIDLQPQNVYGPPSPLFVLSQKASRSRKSIRSLKRIFTSSEYLAHPIKRNIEKSLRAKVYDIYGSTETKEIAWQCSTVRRISHQRG